MAKSEKSTGTAQPPPSQVPIKWNTTNLQSSYGNFCNANSTREEVVLNFVVNMSWERNANAKDGLEIDLNHRIVLRPFSAKRLSALLQQLIRNMKRVMGSCPSRYKQPDCE